MNTGEARALGSKALMFTGITVEGIYLAEKMTDGTIILVPAAGARIPRVPLPALGQEGEERDS